MTRSDVIQRARAILAEAYEEAAELIMLYLDDHPSEQRRSLCREIDPDNYNALDQRVARRQKAREASNQEELSSSRTLTDVRIRHARSAIAKSPEEVVASLPEETLERLADATYEARKTRIRERAPEQPPTIRADAEGEIRERFEEVPGRGSPLITDLVLAYGRARLFGFERIVEEATPRERREWADRLPEIAADLIAVADLAKTVKLQSVQTGRK